MGWFLCLTKKWLIPLFLFLFAAVGLYFANKSVERQQLIEPKAAAETSISVTPATADYAPGDSFDVEVWVNSGTNEVGAVDLVMAFDASLLRVDSFVAGNFFSGGGLATDPNTGQSLLTIDNSLGAISADFFQPLGDLTQGNRVLAVVTFTVRADATIPGTANIGVNFGQTVVGADDGGVIINALELVNNAVVNIVNAPIATPTPVVIRDLSLLLSNSSNRSNPVPLDGQVVSGDIFVFVTTLNEVINRVRFYVDGDLVQTENIVEWDLAGTADDGGADPFDTTTLTDGTHTISARVRLLLAGGAYETVVLNATIIVANGAVATATPTPGSMACTPEPGASVPLNYDQFKPADFDNNCVINTLDYTQFIIYYLMQFPIN